MVYFAKTICAWPEGYHIGNQLLLEPAIEKELKDGNDESINKLIKTHKEGFWFVFDHHIDKCSVEKLLSYSETVYKVLWTEYSIKCNSFISKAYFYKLNFSDIDKIEKIVYLLKLFNEAKFKVEKYWEFLLLWLDDHLDREEFYVESVFYSFYQVQQEIPESQKSIINLKSHKVENWMNWVDICERNDLKISYWVKPSKILINELDKGIKQDHPVPPGYLKLVDYCILSGYYEFGNLVKSCKDNIVWHGQQDGRARNANHVNVLKLLLILSNIDKNKELGISEIFNDGRFYNLLFLLQKFNAIPIASLLVSKYINENSINVQKVNNRIGNFQSGIDLVKKFWKSKNDNNAAFIVENISLYDLTETVWQKAREISNLLIEKVISFAIENKNYKLFVTENALEKLSNSLKFFKNEEDRIGEIVQVFLENSLIEEEIINGYEEDLNFFEYTYELFLVLKNISIPNWLIKKCKEISKDKWRKAFKEDSYLTSIALLIQNRGDQLFLENNFYDAILEFSVSWLKSEIDPTDWQIKNWNNLVFLLRKEFQIQFTNNITQYLSENIKYMNINFLIYNKNFINTEWICKEKIDEIEFYIDEAIRNSDFENLRTINILLETGKTKFSNDFKTVMEKPIYELYHSKDLENSDKSELAKLASYLNIDLGLNSVNDENDTDDDK